MMKDEYIPLAEIVEELENGSRPEGGVDNSGDIFSVGGEHLNDFGGFDFSSVKMISHDFFNKMNRGKIKPDDIVIVKDGATTGKTSFVTEQFPHFPCAINEHVFRLAVNQKVADPKYVFYYLYSPKGNKEILDDFRGATVGGISQDFVNKVFIPLPPLTEQKRIASLLARADRLRKLRETAHDLGDALLQSVFLEMFGDPKTNPNKWKNAKLGDVITSVQDGPHVSPEYAETGVPFLSTRNIRPGQLIWEDMKYISEENAQKFWKRSGSKPEKGDILYTKGGTTGYAKVVDFDQKVAVWVHIAVLKLRKNLVNPFWLESMLNSEYCYKQSQELTFGIANHDFGILRMPRVEMYLPPLSLQKEFAGVVARVESLRGRMGESTRQVEGLFESLLSQSFSGDT